VLQEYDATRPNHAFKKMTIVTFEPHTPFANIPYGTLNATTGDFVGISAAELEEVGLVIKSDELFEMSKVAFDKPAGGKDWLSMMQC
jgi:hypothetical protein